MRGIPSMFPNMVHHVFFSSEVLSTKLASIGSVSSVASHMVIQMFFPGKGFCTCGTAVRLVGRMPLHMAL